MTLAAFRAQGHIFGMKANAGFGCYIFHPGAGTELGDVVSIRGVAGLVQLRRHTSWHLSRARSSDSDEVEIDPPTTIEPLDPDSQASGGAALMKSFCSRPLPRIRNVITPAGYTDTELVLDGLGRESAVTAVLGTVQRGVVSRCIEEHTRRIDARLRVRTSVLSVMVDVLVFAGMFGEIRPRAHVLADHVRDSLTGRESDVLPLDASVKCLGRGPSVLYAPEIPRYQEMIQYAFSRLGWDGQRFDVYRCRVEYPVMPSSLMVHFDLPEKPVVLARSAE